MFKQGDIVGFPHDALPGNHSILLEVRVDVLDNSKSFRGKIVYYKGREELVGDIHNDWLPVSFRLVSRDAFDTLSDSLDKLIEACSEKEKL